MIMTSSGARPDFNLADGHEYMLGRSHAASSRLNLQYYLWKESLHCNIHPSIHVHGASRIADVATGTAIWLINVAREYPSAQLDGFDIDVSQAPPMQWLAPNITLRTWNIFDPVPEELIGIYDVVHVRLLVLVIQKDNLRDVIRTLLRLLRPGGYIQWDELNYPGTHIETSKNSARTPALHELRKRVYSEGRNDWTLRLPDLFADEGLLDNKIYHFKDLPDLVKANGEQHLLTMEEFATSLESKGHREAAADLFRLVQDAGSEMSGGAALSMPRVVCVGRKAGGGSPVSPWYQRDIGPRLKPKIRKIYEGWAGIPSDRLASHLHEIRDRAWNLCKYPCIGEWIFLLPSISNFSRYPEILARTRAGDTVLDLGCCLGQDLRLLAMDGAPPKNMFASDISSELWDLGFDLFRDREKMVAKFIRADVFDTDSGLGKLNGHIDIIIANQFLHLFNWEGQIEAMKTIVRLSKPGSILVGYQRAQVQSQEIRRPWGTMYLHDCNTFRKIWERVELETRTKWDVEADLVDLREWGMEPEDVSWMPDGRKGINFIATRRA